MIEKTDIHTVITILYHRNKDGALCTLRPFQKQSITPHSMWPNKANLWGSGCSGENGYQTLNDADG